MGLRLGGRSGIITTIGDMNVIMGTYSQVVPPLTPELMVYHVHTNDNTRPSK